MTQQQPLRSGIVRTVPLPPKDKSVLVRVSEQDLERWRSYAEAHAMTLSDWMRRTCNAAAPHDLIVSTPAVPLPPSSRKSRKGGR